MILVAKPPRPKLILKKAAAATSDLCGRYDADPTPFATASGVAFEKGIYGTPAVKRHLKAAQMAKCCYCEGISDAHDAGTVEHYRPKGFVKANGVVRKPGYYWLAYDWDNLYYACSVCNESFKRDSFPLLDEASRATDHHARLDLEEPLVLDPGGPRDPRDHIRFEEEAPRALTAAGCETIAVVGLDRPELCRDRRKHLDLVAAQLDVIDVIEALDGWASPEELGVLARARRRLAEYARPAAAYWSATQDLILSAAAPPGMP